MNSAVRPSREALLVALRENEEQMAFLKKELKRLEKEKELLEEELRHEDLEPLHDRLAGINAEFTSV